MGKTIEDAMQDVDLNTSLPDDMRNAVKDSLERSQKLMTEFDKITEKYEVWLKPGG